MKRSLLIAAMISVATLASAACGDDEASTTAGTAGSGGSGSPSCSQASDCEPEPCGSGEAATAACSNGRCSTTCEAGYTTCSECSTPTDCSFVGDLCPPPQTQPNQLCVDGHCSEFCGPGSAGTCFQDADCPKVLCPGSTTAVGQCVAGGCLAATERCCS